MEHPKTTAKDFFLWLGAVIALYWSVIAFTSLIFEYLNHLLPDTLSSYGYFPVSNVSYEMASLIVVFPIFLILMRVIRKGIEADPSRGQIWVRKWALVLTLFVAGATLAGDLIVLLMYFFEGDVTLRFLLKVLVVLVVAGAGFLHFMADLKGYYDRNPAKARLVTWVTALVGIAAVIAGFFIIGTPWQARLERFDTQKVSDLETIQWQTINFWQQKGRLPKSLSELEDPISGFQVPLDPQTGTAYEYRVITPLSFELCAEFNAMGYGPSYHGIPDRQMMAGEPWQHEAGRTCFERPIDPELYPPIKR